LHVKNSLKSTVLMDLLKAAILVKLTKKCRFILTVSRSWLKVTATGRGSQSQEGHKISAAAGMTDHC